MLGRRRCKFVCQVQLIGVIGAQRGKQSCQNDDDQKDDRKDGHGVGLDFIDNVLPQAAVVDGAQLLGLFFHALEGVFMNDDLIFHLLRQSPF